MLAYILALVVGLSSVALYMAAFFFPEVHRKHDFLWSGLGMFYALVLWVCAGRITGGVLLGQTASVVLLGWMGWQTLALRRQVAPVDQQTAIPTSDEWRAALSQMWAGLSSAKALAPIAQPLGKQVAKLAAWVEALVTTTTTPTSAPPSSEVEDRPYVPLTPADFANARQKAVLSPPPTIVTDAVPVKTGEAVSPKENVQSKGRTKVQPQESTLTTIAKQIQGSFKGMTGKRESKPVYVRKQFRTPEAEEQPAVDGFSKKTGSVVPESISPEQSTLDTITTTSQDAAANLSEPSATVINAEPIADSESSP